MSGSSLSCLGLAAGAIPKEPTMDRITLDTADAVGLIEILDYFNEMLDRITEHDALARVIEISDTYEISDLREDVARLTHRLERSEIAP
jgi:hypothetical protein